MILGLGFKKTDSKSEVLKQRNRHPFYANAFSLHCQKSNNFEQKRIIFFRKEYSYCSIFILTLAKPCPSLPQSKTISYGPYITGRLEL